MDPSRSNSIPSTFMQSTSNKDTTRDNDATHSSDTILTEEGAVALMELLLQRNAFHHDPPLSLQGNRYLWPHVFMQEIEEFIWAQQPPGKVPLSLVQQHWRVSREILLEQVLPPQSSAQSILLLGHYPQEQLWTKQYLQTSLEQLWQTVEQSEPQLLPVSHVAKSMWQLSLSTALELIREHIHSSTIELRTTDKGTPVLLGRVYRTKLEQHILDHFRTCITTPTSIRTVCMEQQWEFSWVLPLLQQNSTSLPGLVHHENVYVPDQYLQQQQQIAVDQYQTVGVVTDANHSLHQLMNWLSSCDDEHPPVILAHALVHPGLICHPLQVALQEADDGVLDLQPYVPSSLSREDGQLLLQHVTPKDGSLFVWKAENQVGLFFGGAMIASFLQHTMPLLIQEYAQERAPELVAEYGASVIQDSVFVVSDERKQSHKKKKAVIAIDYGTVPVERVVERIRNQYGNDLSGCDDDTIWNEICTVAFLSSDLHVKQYQTAIHAELERMLTQQTSATATTVASTNHMLSVELERTECFAYACYLVQLSDHFVQYAQEAGMEDIAVLQKEYVQGPCADLTWRISQYCLFRNHVNDDGEDCETFSFGTTDDSSYYKPVDLALRSYPPFRLTCGKAKDPLVQLRQRLPGTDGVSLSQMWILCCGMNTTNNNNNTMEAFQAHVQDNCLPLIGLPYKILDKKSEKKFLSARRDVLLQRLQSAPDPALVLDYTIMLLYQQVKNMVVSGSLLRGPILRLLTNERKITSEVAGDLMALAAKIEKGEVAESDLVERVRNCALKKK